MLSQEEVRAWLERMTGAWNRRDAAAVAACYAPDAEVVSAGDSDPVRGTDALIETLQMLFNGFPDIEHHTRASVVEGQCVAIEWSLTGTHSGLLPSPEGFLPPTGASIDIAGVSFIWLNDEGQAMREHSYTDPTLMARQLGLFHEHRDHDDDGDAEHDMHDGHDHSGHGHQGQATLNYDPDDGYGKA
ncbi:MAG: nuclear transport factor 2 family protein [Chloroflexi bacterium]|nr:nuclear transport factor 2 family protein [Chloroflexota bacterium]